MAVADAVVATAAVAIVAAAEKVVAAAVVIDSLTLRQQILHSSFFTLHLIR